MAIDPPQRYQNQGEPVLILALLPGHLRSYTLEMDGKVQGPFSTRVITPPGTKG